MSKAFCAVVGALALVALPSAVSAQTTVVSSRAAWVTNAGYMGSRTSNQNTFTGFSSNLDYRSYISYSIPQSTRAFTSAVIRVNTADIRNGPNDLTVYDVSSDIATATGADLYADFGSGTILGSITGLSTSNATIDITLNADGLAAVNAAQGSTISFGFVSSPTTAASDGVFGATNGSTLRQLILTPTVDAPDPVPTMSEWAMILFGLGLAGGAAVYTQRRRVFA